MIPGVGPINGGAGGIKGGNAKSGSRQTSSVKIDQTGLGSITFGGSASSNAIDKAFIIVPVLVAVFLLGRK